MAIIGPNERIPEIDFFNEEEKIAELDQILFIDPGGYLAAPSKPIKLQVSIINENIS